MKTGRLIVLLLIGGLVRLTAQIEVVSGGNVGIGTAAPQARLSISNGNFLMERGRQITFTNSVGGIAGSVLELYTDDNVYLSNPTSSGNIIFRTQGGTERLKIRPDGNVGIGTTLPSSGRLQVEGGDIALGADGSDRRLLIWSNTEGADAILIRRSDNSSPVSIATSAFGKSLLFKVGGSEIVRFRNDGNVGIGTPNPGYKLEVAGTVRATSFISNTTTYADFVFKPGYKLPSLSEVEAHIAEHGTLPGVPSESQVAKEGIDLAAMQVKLLQKIEELTLHQIAQEKRIQRLEEENTRLKSRP